jgi:hypothetical protein
MTVEQLRQFCDNAGAKYQLTDPHVFVDRVTEREFTYATDGHRLVAIEGRLEGVDKYQGVNISSFLINPCGVQVETAKLKKFLQCDLPTTQKCSKCNDGLIEVTCEDCTHTHTHSCGCDGKGEPIVRRGVIGYVPFNTCLLAEPMKYVSDETVTVHLTGKETCFYVFASGLRIVIMPMREGGESFKAAPRFEIPGAVEVQQ